LLDKQANVFSTFGGCRDKDFFPDCGVVALALGAQLFT
jgi:hypothetical protein